VADRGGAMSEEKQETFWAENLEREIGPLPLPCFCWMDPISHIMTMLAQKGFSSSLCEENLKNVKHIAASYMAFCALRSDGTVVVWGKDAQRRSHRGDDGDRGAAQGTPG